MMKLITGTPGAGKTLYVVSLLHQLSLEQDKKVEKGETPRDIYTNIEGLSIPGVDVLPDNDWRNLPDGSLVVYDEAHQIFRATGKPGLSNDPVISNMDMHRHRGFDLWFITQFPTKVHHEIRSMCDEHVHLLRQCGAKQATLFRWPEASNVGDKSVRSMADKSFFRYPKECFKFYKSASLHTAKFRLPAKIKFLAVVIVAISSFVGFRLISNDGFASLATATAAPPVVLGDGKGSEAPSVTPDNTLFVVVGGCVSSSKACQCYTRDLFPIQQSDSECRALAAQPLLMGLEIEKK